jgi:hypothetical protein
MVSQTVIRGATLLYLLNPTIMLSKILEQANDFKVRTAKLKAMSEYWPIVRSKNFEGFEIALTTLVRICRQGKWYAIHCVESGIVQIGSHEVEAIFERLIDSVHKVQNLYVIQDLVDSDGVKLDELDELQMEESTRLMEGIQRKRSLYRGMSLDEYQEKKRMGGR